MKKFEINNFSETAEIYEDVRPTYPGAMYHKILELIPHVARSRMLEIGPGPGNSTKEFLKYFPGGITACEPNPDFSRLFMQHFTGHPHVTLIRERFEDNTFANESFDVIFAATTFHWLDESMKYAEAARLLSPGGWLILYWNNYLVMDTALKDKLSALFDTYGANIEMVNGTLDKILAKINKRKNEIESGAYFSVVSHDLFEVKYQYSADKFCALLKTFADQSLGDEMPALLEAVRELVLEHGNTVNINVITNLEIAAKN